MLLFPAEYDSQRRRIRALMDGMKRATTSEIAEAVAHQTFIIEMEANSKFLIIDGDPHLFSAFTKQLMPISHRDSRFAAHLAMVYGLNARDDLAPKVASLLESKCLWTGAKMRPRRWTAFLDGTLYLSRYDGTVFKVAGAGVTEDANKRLIDDGWGSRSTGSIMSFEIEDNAKTVLFADDDGGMPPPDPLIGRNGHLFRLLRGVRWASETVGHLRKCDQVRAFMVWMLMVAFPDIFPTKPILMLEGAAGSGKCLGRGTRVIRFDGTTCAVEDVKQGDLLMGPDSKPRRVLDTTVGTGPLYRVTPTQGEPWVCNDKHVLTLVGSARHPGKVIDVPIADFAAASATFRDNFKQFFVGVDFPKSRLSRPIDPYFLGVWYGDGTKTLRPSTGLLEKVQVTKPDPEIEAVMRDTATAWGATVNKVTNSVGCPGWNITYGQHGKGHKNALLEVLRDVYGDGTQLPTAYLRAPRVDRAAFLAGLLDTDGHLTGNCFDIVQRRRGFADGICFLARSLGLRASLSEKYVAGYDHTYWRINISGDLTMLPLRIPRKQPAPRRQRKDVRRTGITVEPIGDGEYAGFQLDGDGRFLLGDFTVTHNSTLLQMAQMALHGKLLPVGIEENGIRDFWVSMLRSPITFLDDVNADYKWLPDEINRYATGGIRVERKLYKNSEEVTIAPQSFIAVATMDPRSFRRGDTVDRSIVLRMERREYGLSADAIRTQIINSRAAVYGEWLYYLNRTVAALRLEPPRWTTQRLGDFEVFAYAAARAVGWNARFVPDLMAALSRERSVFAAETDVVLEVLDDWMNFPSNESKWISARDLFKELNALAYSSGKPFVKTPQALAQRLRAPHVAAQYYVADSVDRDRKIYCITRAASYAVEN